MVVGFCGVLFLGNFLLEVLVLLSFVVDFGWGVSFEVVVALLMVSGA